MCTVGASGDQEITRRFQGLSDSLLSILLTRPRMWSSAFEIEPKVATVAPFRRSDAVVLFECLSRLAPSVFQFCLHAQTAALLLGRFVQPFSYLSLGRSSDLAQICADSLD
jgi:hypothetical protein